MKRFRGVLLLSVIALSMFALMGFIKPSQMNPDLYPWGKHVLAFNYYISYIYDDHDGFLMGAGEWYFGLYSYEIGMWRWSGEYSRDGPGWVDHVDLVWSYYMYSAKFRLYAYEDDVSGPDPDSIAIYDFTIPSDWGYVYSTNTWYSGAVRRTDTEFYLKFKISNDAPTSDPIEDRFVYVGDPLWFNSTASDPEGDDLSYEWDFDYDGVTFTVDSTEQNAGHIFSEDGVYTVGLRVKDYFGAYSSVQTATVLVVRRENLDIGFSKYGEMINYNETTGIGLGMQYPGYEGAGNSYDQRDDTSVDPFANEYIDVDWWLNGWFIDIKYRTIAGVWREIWAFALSSDGSKHGGDWITMPAVAWNSSARPLWQEYPPYANPDSSAYYGIVDPIPPSGGRKTNGYCETEPLEIVYDGPRRLVAICKTRIFDVTLLNLVDLTFTFILNKAEKNVIVLKDIESLYMKSYLNIQFGNRGEWALGLAGDVDSYIHWYTSEPVQYWDTDGDDTINKTEVETTFPVYKDYFLAHKHPEKWWDEVPQDERPTSVYNEWTEVIEDFPETWLEAQETCYGREEHTDDTVKENSYAVAQIIAAAGDYVGALAVWPHPEFWSAANFFFPPARTVAPAGENPSSIPLMLAPISRMLEWHKWTVEEDPNQNSTSGEDLDDRDDIWVKADDIRTPSGYTLEPLIPFTIYEHDFKLSLLMREYRIVSVYMLTDYHDADDADADDPGNEETWSSGLNRIDSEIQYQFNEIFNHIHDIAVKDIVASKDLVGQGQIVSINATVENQGNLTENLDIIAYANTMIIDTLANVTLTSGNSANVTLTWDTTGVPVGNYSISIFAIPVLGEIDLSDNTNVDDFVAVTIPGDINGDVKVNHKDLLLLASAYGSEVGDPKYIPEADLNNDGRVDHKDLLILASNYGKET